jgi:diguanylate cyclase
LLTTPLPYPTFFRSVYRRGDTASSIVERADNALMQAKRDGRNRTVTEDAILDAAKVA